MTPTRIGASGTVSASKPVIGASSMLEVLPLAVTVGASCTLTVEAMTVQIGAAAHLNSRSLDGGSGTLIGITKGVRKP